MKITIKEKNLIKYRLRFIYRGGIVMCVVSGAKCKYNKITVKMKVGE